MTDTINETEPQLGVKDRNGTSRSAESGAKEADMEEKRTTEYTHRFQCLMSREQIEDLTWMQKAGRYRTKTDVVDDALFMLKKALEGREKFGGGRIVLMDDNDNVRATLSAL